MDTNRFNRWLTLSANIGVIAGLILIANDYYLADMDLELAMMGEDPTRSWTKAVYTPGELNSLGACRTLHV